MLHYLLLDNFNVHVPYFIFYLETCKVMVTTLISFPVLFQSNKLSNSCIFRISLTFYSIYFKKIIIYRKIRCSNSDDLECDAPNPGGPVDHHQPAEYLCLIS